MGRFLLLALAACAAARDVADSADLAASLGPQSFVHGTVRGPPVFYSFHGGKGELISPDLWPTGRSALHPTLALLDARRKFLARGTPRGADPRHLAIDGVRLPETGTYFVAVGGDGGQFTLRFWTESSHLPRQEARQIDLTTRPSAKMLSVSAPLADAAVDELVRYIGQETDLRTALSDAHLLLWMVTPEQRPRARPAAAALVGTPEHFRSLDPSLQAFALWWLGNLDRLFFETADLPQPAAIDAQIARLIAAWPGAKEDRPRLKARTLNGAIYGWQADWSAAQTDFDGRQIWIDFATEWFDAKGGYLGEQSAGASEPDDD